MIIPDSKEFSLEIPHLGITVRSIMGAADAAAKEMKIYRRRWKLKYKDVIIGSIQLANFEENQQSDHEKNGDF